MKTYQTTIDGRRWCMTIPDGDDAAGADASGDPSEARLAESLADALQSIACMPPVAPGDAITLGDAINAYHGAVRIARDAVKFYNARRRASAPAPAPGDGDAMLDAIAGELSPQAQDALAAIEGAARRAAGLLGVLAALACGATAMLLVAAWALLRLVALGGNA